MNRMNNWLKLLRISNAPTCLSNVLVGCAIGMASVPDTEIATFIDPAAVLWVIGSVFGFYFGGMALNDVLDVRQDQASGAPRPIAQGHIGRMPAALVAIALLAFGVVAAALSGGANGLITGLTLLACIVIYDLWHRATWPAMILMGCCRGLVYVLAACSVTDQPDTTMLLVLSLGLSLHTALITGIARSERTTTRPAIWYVALLPLAPCGALALLHDQGGTTSIAVFGIMLALWLGRITGMLRDTPPRVIPAVLAGLSAIALLDAFYLAILGGWILSLLAVACFALTTLAHRSISGT
ncbi:MAG: hypothetical protein MK095_02410 [Phycisphaerales bacterium]|nr:hypothetical protein [Phycisphaerales bacterium]